jgi:hypothetical protein
VSTIAISEHVPQVRHEIIDASDQCLLNLLQTLLGCLEFKLCVNILDLSFQPRLHLVYLIFQIVEFGCGCTSLILIVILCKTCLQLLRDLADDVSDLSDIGFKFIEPLSEFLVFKSLESSE